MGLILGLAGGLYYTWIVEPVVYVSAGPARLSEAHKAEYIFLVSQSYALDGNWERAQQRLAALDDPAIRETVMSLLETYLREQKPPGQIENLAVLARELGAQGNVVALFAPTPLAGVAATATATATPVSLPTQTPTPTRPPTETPPPTMTATATRQPSPSPRPVYRLLNQQRVCQSNSPATRIEVEVLDALLDPLPGVEVVVNWEDGSDHFFTGFKPAQGPGYADFAMRPDVSYTVMLPEGSPEISGLRIEPCDNGLDGGWRLTFQNLLLRPTETPVP